MKGTKILFRLGVLVLGLSFMILTGCSSPTDSNSGDDGGGGGTQYTVTYSAGGGSGSAPASQTVTAGTAITLPAQGSMTAPSGQTFNGWKDDGGTTYSAGASYTVNASVTFTAQWTTGGGGQTGGGDTLDPTIRPDTPTGVTATALSSGSIQISWSAPTSGGTVVNYKVWWSASSSGTYALEDTVSGSATSCTVVDFNAATTYYFKISAINSIGESNQSSSVSARTRNALIAPTNVVAAHADYSSRLNTSRNSIRITWNPVSGAVSYNVYEYVGNSWIKVRNAVTGTEWTHTGLQPATSHSYVVHAVDSGGYEGTASTIGGNAMGRTAP
ncbi:fibronectin type III domain-containing protein [Breznakiellaceae bacterium SP9]